MTESQLERRLREHYQTISSSPSPHLAGRVEAALDGAPARRFGSARLGFGRSRLVLVGAAMAAVAVFATVAIALAPLWYGRPAATTPAGTSHPPAAPDLAAAGVWRAGFRDGVVWAVRGESPSGYPPNYLRISTDAGRTWSANPMPQRLGSFPAIDVVGADNAWAVVAGPMNADQTAQYYVYRTGDGGATWQIAPLPGVYESSGYEIHFVDKTDGYVVLTPSAGDPTPSTILRSEDGGLTWIVTGTRTRLSDNVVAVGSDTLWMGASENLAPGPRPLLQVSRDRGASWSAVGLPGIDTIADDAHFVPGGVFAGPTFLNEKIGFVSVVVGGRGAADAQTRYFKTMDGGFSWTQVATLDREALGSAFRLDEWHWYQPVQYSPWFEETLDGGKTWTLVDEAGMAEDFVVSEIWMADGQTGAALGFRLPGDTPDNLPMALLLTADGGRTWSPATFGAPLLNPDGGAPSS